MSDTTPWIALSSSEDGINMGTLCTSLAQALLDWCLSRSPNAVLSVINPDGHLYCVNVTHRIPLFAHELAERTIQRVAVAGASTTDLTELLSLRVKLYAKWASLEWYEEALNGCVKDLMFWVQNASPNPSPSPDDLQHGHASAPRWADWHLIRSLLSPTIANEQPSEFWKPEDQKSGINLYVMRTLRKDGSACLPASCFLGPDEERELQRAFCHAVYDLFPDSTGDHLEERLLGP